MKCLIMITCIFLFSCSDYKRLNNIEKEVSEMINQRKGTEFLLNLDSITVFDWDELLILKPYSVLDSIEKDIGYTLKCVPNLIEHHDSFIVFVFFNGGKCYGYIELERNFKFVSFPKSEHCPLLARKDCILTIKAYD